MGQLEKLIKRIKNNPKTVRFEELDKLLLRAEFECRQPSGGSSHYTYYKGDKTVTIPRKLPYISRIYVLSAMDAIGDFYDKEEE